MANPPLKLPVVSAAKHWSARYLAVVATDAQGSYHARPVKNCEAEQPWHMLIPARVAPDKPVLTCVQDDPPQLV